VKRKLLFLFLFFSFAFTATGQINIDLYQQFNGRYDFTFVGNTLNTHPNGANDVCEILTSSSANLNLNNGDSIEKAYLYWAGSGTGDFEIKLNGQDIVASRTFPVLANNTDGITRPFFSAFADVTTIVQSSGNGTYTVSDFDLTNVINEINQTPAENIYCRNGTNFGGWAIIVFYKNDNLPLNQLNLYDGLQFVPTNINISLPSLNVIDNIGAKIGFIAWEGDNTIPSESLTMNGVTLGNPPLNPANNAFNGTNSITGSNTLYNMDLDVYDIQNFIQIGDQTADIQLTSTQDFVMVNAVITKLNSQLPDATVTFDNVELACNSRVITVDYTVFNTNSTDSLPAGTPVSIYVNGDFLQSFTTTSEIAIGGSQSGTITLTIPNDVPPEFELLFVADDAGGGNGGTVTETDETNNTYMQTVTLAASQPLQQPAEVTSCNQGFGVGIFDFSAYEESLKNNPTDVVTFYTSQADAEQGTNAIMNTTSFISTANPQQIYVRLDNGTCYITGSFPLRTLLCPPEAYNYVTPNGDDINDTFFVKGLRDIFVNFKMSIYNRWGSLVWTGNNTTPDWDGIANEDKVGSQDTTVPVGTYYFVLELNEPDYPKPIVGWVYVTK
jgi:gliding motility-associated-like protein